MKQSLTPSYFIIIMIPILGGFAINEYFNIKDKIAQNKQNIEFIKEHNLLISKFESYKEYSVKEFKDFRKKNDAFKNKLESFDSRLNVFYNHLNDIFFNRLRILPNYDNMGDTLFKENAIDLKSEEKRIVSNQE